MAFVIPQRVIILVFLLTLVLTRVNGDKEEKEQDPGMVERAIGFTDIASRLESVKTWLKMAWLNIRSPDSGNANVETAQTGKSTDHGEVVKEAATKSFKASKETIEHAAASAAKVAGEAVEKTKKKAKKTAYAESEL